MARDLVIISMHEKGFPQADFYYGHGETPAAEFEALGCTPDAYFSLSKCQPIEAAKAKAAAKWAGA
jgi:hypothetical protein